MIKMLITPRFKGNGNGDFTSVFSARSGYGTYPYEAISRGPDRHVLKTIDRFVPAGGTVLELGCNAGNNLLALAEKGYRVSGIDLSLEALILLRQRASQSQLTSAVRVKRWDFAEPNSTLPTEWDCQPGCFDAIYAVHTLSHLSDERLIAVMQALQSYLKSGGIMLVTLMLPLLQRAQPLVVEEGSVSCWTDQVTASTEELFKKGFVAHSKQTVGEAFSGLKLLVDYSMPWHGVMVSWFLPKDKIHWLAFQK